MKQYLFFLLFLVSLTDVSGQARIKKYGKPPIRMGNGSDTTDREVQYKPNGGFVLVQPGKVDIEPHPTILTSVSSFSTATAKNVIHPDGGLFTKVTGAVSTSIAGYGVMIFNGSGGIRYERLVTGSVNARLFGANPANVDNYTAFMAAYQYCTATGRTLFIDDGEYVTSPLSFLLGLHLELSPGATLKLKNSASLVGNDLFVVRFYASNSSLTGGTVDFNRAGQSQDAFNSAGGSAVRSYRGVQIAGTSGIPVKNISISTRILNSVDHGLSVVYCTSGVFDVDVDNSGSGQLFQNCQNIKIRSTLLSNLDNSDWKIYPHAFDLNSCSNVTVENLTIQNQSGYDNQANGSSMSDWFSGVTIVDCAKITFSGLRVQAKHDLTMVKSVGVSLLSLYNSQFNNMEIRAYSDASLEVGGCDNLQFSNFIIDAEYMGTAANTSEGLSIYNNGYYGDFKSRSARQSTNIQFTGGSVIRHTGSGGFLSSLSNCVFTEVNFNSNRNGIATLYQNIDPSFSGGVAQKSTGNVFVNCKFSYNEYRGVQFPHGVNWKFIDCDFSNNGQAKTTRGSRFRHAAFGALTDVTAGFVTFNQNSQVRTGNKILRPTAKDTQSDTTNYGSSSPASLSVVSVSNPSRFTHGQTIKLKGGGASGSDLLAQIVDIHGDELTIDTVLTTLPLITGTGTLSTSGTTITGAGTDFSNQLPGRFWIKVGTEYRQILSVSSATAAVLVSAFPANLSGLSFQIVRLSTREVRSQEYGIRLNSTGDEDLVISQPDTLQNTVAQISNPGAVEYSNNVLNGVKFPIGVGKLSPSTTGGYLDFLNYGGTTSARIFDNGNVGIGTGSVTDNTTINASSAMFPAYTPKLEVRTGTTTSGFEEAVVFRHTAMGSGAATRRLALLLKLSSESSTTESNKVAGLFIESVSTFGNNPYLGFVTANAERARIANGGNFLIGKTVDDGGSKLQVTGTIATDVVNYYTSGTSTAGISLSRTSNGLELSTGVNPGVSSGTSRWQWSTGGHLLASTDSTLDIGATSFANRPRNLYVANTMQVPRIDLQPRANEPNGIVIRSATGSSLSGRLFFTAPTGTTTFYQSTVGLEIGTGGTPGSSTGTSRWRVTNAGSLLAATDGGVDIGANGGSRPGNVYVASSVYAGGISLGIATKTAAYTMVAATDYTVRADAASGAFSVTLPPATGNTGRVFIIKKTDNSANAVTVAGTIDAVTNYSLTSQNQYVAVQSDGGTYSVIAATEAPKAYVDAAVAGVTPTVTNTDYAINGIALSSCGLLNVQSTRSLTSGTAYSYRVTAPVSATVTKVVFEVVTNAGTLSGGSSGNNISIYNASGTQLGWADCSTGGAFTGTGLKSVNLASSMTLTAGTEYIIVVVCTASTPLSLTSTNAITTINANQSAAPYRHQSKTSFSVASGGAITPASGWSATTSQIAFIGLAQ
jgi:hypothetical protein